MPAPQVLPRKRIILGSCGIQYRGEFSYAFGDKTENSCFSSIALAKLLPENEKPTDLVNNSGGTSLMASLIGELARVVENEFQRPVRRFVSFDTRSHKKQSEDPYVLGEIFYLDPDPNKEIAKEVKQ